MKKKKKVKKKIESEANEQIESGERRKKANTKEKKRQITMKLIDNDVF